MQFCFLKVPDDVIEELFNSTRPPPMVHALPTEKKTSWKLEARFLKAFLGQADNSLSNKKKKTKAFNILDSDPDFKNCNGWSTAVGKKDLHLLKGSNIGVFMVNLTKVWVFLMINFNDNINLLFERIFRFFFNLCLCFLKGFDDGATLESKRY